MHLHVAGPLLTAGRGPVTVAEPSERLHRRDASIDPRRELPLRSHRRRIDPEPATHLTTAHHHRSHALTREQAVAFGRIDADEQTTLTARRHRHVTGDEECEATEHPLLGVLRPTDQQVADAISELGVECHGGPAGWPSRLSITIEAIEAIETIETIETIEATAALARPVWHAERVTVYRIRFTGPPNHAMRMATALADADGVDLVSSSPPVVIDADTVQLDLSADGTHDDIADAISTIGDELPDGASIEVIGS